MRTLWNLRHNLRTFQGEQGQDLSEYALLIGFIAIFVLVAVNLLGINIAALFNYLSSVINSIAS